MSDRKYHLHDGKSGAALAVQVTPRAPKNEITQILADGTLHIRLDSSGDDNVMNLALTNFLAELLEIKPNQLEIVAGTHGQDKLVAVLNMDSATVQSKILHKTKT